MITMAKFERQRDLELDQLRIRTIFMKALDSRLELICNAASGCFDSLSRNLYSKSLITRPVKDDSSKSIDSLLTSFKSNINLVENFTELNKKLKDFLIALEDLGGGLQTAAARIREDVNKELGKTIPFAVTSVTPQPVYNVETKNHETHEFTSPNIAASPISSPKVKPTVAAVGGSTNTDFNTNTDINTNTGIDTYNTEFHPPDTTTSSHQFAAHNGSSVPRDPQNPLVAPAMHSFRPSHSYASSSFQTMRNPFHSSGDPPLHSSIEKSSQQAPPNLKCSCCSKRNHHREHQSLSYPNKDSAKTPLELLLQKQLDEQGEELQHVKQERDAARRERDTMHQKIDAMPRQAGKRREEQELEEKRKHLDKREAKKIESDKRQLFEKQHEFKQDMQAKISQQENKELMVEMRMKECIELEGRLEKKEKALSQKKTNLKQFEEQQKLRLTGREMELKEQEGILRQRELDQIDHRERELESIRQRSQEVTDNWNLYWKKNGELQGREKDVWKLQAKLEERERSLELKENKYSLIRNISLALFVVVIILFFYELMSIIDYYFYSSELLYKI